MKKQKTILISNDDGCQSEGILALARALSPIAKVIIVAPASNQSAVSHSMSLRNFLRLVKHPPLVTDSQVIDIYGVEGTPSDSVYMGVNHILKDTQVDLVVSGINHGGNLANDVFYSGTVSAAREAVFLGIPAVAISLVANHSFDFSECSKFIASFVTSLLDQPLPRGMLLNINIPKVVTKKEIAVTVVGQHSYELAVDKRRDPRGEDYFWIGGAWSGFEDLPGTDCKAIADGYISLTPISLELTNEKLLSWSSALKIKGYQSQELYREVK